MAATTKTLTVAAIGGSPSRLASAAGNVPVRALVRNGGDIPVAISYSANALTGIGNPSDAYVLPPGEADVFVLEPGDILYAAGVGGEGTVSVASSRAFPATHGAS